MTRERASPLKRKIKEKEVKLLLKASISIELIQNFFSASSLMSALHSSAYQKQCFMIEWAVINQKRWRDVRMRKYVKSRNIHSHAVWDILIKSQSQGKSGSDK